jgi:hypothetical protein
MQTLDKIIIYDNDCPLCSAYTNTFVKTGLIKKENRKDFSTITPNLLQLIDVERSKNEIPVIELPTNKVYYGVDGLVEILSAKIPFVKPIANAKAINWGLKKLYKLVSFNRRVIVATKTKVCNFNCTPQFNVKYRLFFAFIFLLFNTVMLFPLHKNIVVLSIFSHTSIIQLQMAHLLLVVLNIGIAILLTKQEGIEFIGQINMLATISILLFVPLVLLNKYQIIQSKGVNNVYMLLLLFFIVKEYLRRMNFAEIVAKHKWIIWVNGTSILLFLLYLIL